MSDRFSAQIFIGGQIPRNERLLPDDKNDDTTIFQGLISVLNSDGASHDYGDKVIPVNCTEQELLSRYLDDDGLLTFKNDQAVLGEFQETEEFCIQNQIPFDRCSDHYCEYDAERVCYRDYMNVPHCTMTDSNGNDVVDGDSVSNVLAKLGVALGLSSDIEMKNKVSEAVDILRDICSDVIENLPSFQIVS